MAEGEERELEEHVEQRNYVAALALAQRLEKPPETIRELREAALKQYITEYRNAPGAVVIVQEFQFRADEVARLLEAILEEARAGEGKRLTSRP